MPSAGSFVRIKETVESIRSITTYENYEVIFVTGSAAVDSNGAHFESKNVVFVRYDKPFNFSDKCNVGASNAKGEYVIFLNDDVRVISPDWIETISGVLDVARRRRRQSKIELRKRRNPVRGYGDGGASPVWDRLSLLPITNDSIFQHGAERAGNLILSGACMAMPLQLFNEVGGWDAHNTPSAHSDIDLSFKIRERGYSCIYTPYAELTHIGHVEIGWDEAEASKVCNSFKKNKADIFMLKRWGHYCERDPISRPR